jgi:methyl-accepting chemotaxis protein
MSESLRNRVGSRYSQRVGPLLVATLAVTLVLGGVFTVHAANTGAGVPALAGTLFVTALNLGLLGIVLGGNVGVELRRFIEDAEAIEDGDLDVTPISDGPDEFGDLADTLDDMRLSLGSASSTSTRSPSRACSVI